MKRHLPLVLALLSGPALGQFVEPPEAVDINPDPNIVEVNLTASETTWEYISGVQTTVWAYNGSVPGPTIRANLGDTIRINFTNNLPAPTTIHWHGVEVPATVDGSHISQNPIPPGGSYVYEWTALNDGMHWYHPHVNPFDQVEKGLHGVLIIKNEPREALFGFNALEEHILVFDDILLDGSNQVVPAFSFSDPLQNAIYHLNGREGNLLLVNGKDASTATLNVANGQPQRWRVLNAANTTLCRLDLRSDNGGMDETIWQIGTGQGFVNEPFPLGDLTPTYPQPPPDNSEPGPDHPAHALLSQMGQGVMLFPGARMDVVFTPIGNDGETFTVWQSDWYRGRHTAFYTTAGTIGLGQDPMDGMYPDQHFVSITVNGPDPGTGEYVLPSTLRRFPNWTVQAKGTKTLMIGHGDPDPVTGNVVLFNQAEMVNGMMSPLPWPKMNSFKAHDMEVGDVWRWEIVNLSHGEHSFHSHGFKFELVEYEFSDDVTPTNNFFFFPSQKRQYSDIIRTPPRPGDKGTSRTYTRLRTVIDDTGREGQVAAHGHYPTFDHNGDFTSGGWLAHCHILEHSGKGMLTFYEVRDPSDPYKLLGMHLDGTNGKASLTVEGTPAPGNPLTFHVVNALPNTTVYLAAGNIAANRPFRGGTVVPGITHNGTTVASSPKYRQYIFSSDATGHAAFTTNVWENAPSGSELYWQAAFMDPGAPAGWAISNALSFTRP